MFSSLTSKRLYNLSKLNRFYSEVKSVNVGFEESTRQPSHSQINKKLQVYGDFITSCLPKYIHQFQVYKDELTLCIPPSGVLPVFHFLRDHHATQFKQCIDVCGVDYPMRENRFEVVYHMLSVRYNTRIRVKTYANEVSSVPSIAELYNAANWFEREAWDMYGIFFTGHPDLRRILTDYGFEGHPLRKDFPLTGYVEVRYDDEKKRVVAEKLELAQQFRYFDYTSPWEQTGEGKPSEKVNFAQLPEAEKKEKVEEKKV
ncbi:hypothetical protein HK099_006218 [Clydaea vesicula]|uniref:NADH:ubiquinone oxidoreductase 30kDa subunit domain-containing protein n=1 Tax=Clydaea vesicula TaxID=447962 RepID=A0AAD5XUE9_9FUNG|nr:hypothetical protein HK099_006218 [Clydaea vesicula]